MNKAIAIVGIHTDIGKTIVSAVVTEALDGHYWKPVQAGSLDYTDKHVVQRLISNGQERVHDEAVLLSQPMSPHAAAVIDNIQIDYKQFTWPVTENILLVETAGGVLSPMSADTTMADFVQYYKLPVILVSQNYLGSINHTLLCIEVLKNRNIPLLGIIISGDTNVNSETFIEQYTGVPIIARVPFLTELNNAKIIECTMSIKDALLQHINNGSN